MARCRRYSGDAFRSVGRLGALGRERGRIGGRRPALHRFLDRGGPQRGGAHVDEGDAGGPVADRGDADDRPVLGAAVELLERPAGAGHLGHADLDEHLVGRERGLEEAFEEVGGRDLASSVRSLGHDRATEREHDRRKVGCRIAVREGSAQRAAVAHLRVADLVRRRARAAAPARAGARMSRARDGAPARRSRSRRRRSSMYERSGTRRDVDEHRGRRQPQLHQRQERVTTCEQLGVVAVLDEQRDRFFGRRRAHVVECRGDHGCASTSVPRSAAHARTAFTMLWYPVQRQRLPSSPSRTRRSSSSGSSSRSDTIAITMPGVQ